ncbi:uncharacterized protein VP01_2480g4 [Puccinia sorghi]|uniref:Uncharacterized protein n=1 Tax=Puccinia sorghi TaxID=27349 RepID=A0A0L6V5X9_9BASI|nr:uncharacterized protein VP01_2480g4 [Puccinia sorghi]
MKATSALNELMTWGEIMSTPVRLDGEQPGTEAEAGSEFEMRDEETAGAFRISKRPRREELAIGMARQASKSLREKYAHHGAGLAAGAHPGRSESSRLRMSLLGRGHQASPSSSVRTTPGSALCHPCSASPRREEILSPAAKLLLHKTGSKTALRHPSNSPAKVTALNSSLLATPPVPKKPGIFTPLHPARH